MEYPYQVVVFFGTEPAKGEPIYEGAHGWLPQLAVKRRFHSNDEPDMLGKVADIAAQTAALEVHFGVVTQPARLPVEVVTVEPTSALLTLHKALFRALGPSKFADREGEHYIPHMTISWRDRRVVDPSGYENQIKMARALWVVKDRGDDTVALQRILLGA